MRFTRRAFSLWLGLSTLGFRSQVTAEEKAPHPEVLEFRLAKAKALHIHDEKTAKSYEKSFKTIKIDCKLNGHDGHFDLSFECPKWKKAELASHAEVTKWEKWLVALGFETKHTH